MAQEVEPVIREIVRTNADGYKSVDYPKLTAFLIEVAKAQQKEIEAQRAESEAQKAEIDALKIRLSESDAVRAKLLDVGGTARPG